jgi:hypothetical protein
VRTSNLTYKDLLEDPVTSACALFSRSTVTFLMYRDNSGCLGASATTLIPYLDRIRQILLSVWSYRNAVFYLKTLMFETTVCTRRTVSL